MNDQQAAEMLNLLREMNAKFDKLESKIDIGLAEVRTEMREGFARLDVKIDRLGDQIAEGFDRVLQTHDREHAELDTRVKRIEKIFDGWTAQ